MDSKLLFMRSLGVVVGVTSDVTVTFTDFCSNLLRLLSATGTIFSVANYLWPPSEYTIAIVLVTDCHRAATVIIFTC